MSTNFFNYYEILGVPRTATLKEIRHQYRELAKKHRIDRLMGLKNKYQASVDKDLLEIIEEKIRLAQEAMKEINEAYGVLSDTPKRAKYDQEIDAVHVSSPPPEIVISPTRIDFETVEQGKRRSRFFTVDNRGGPAVSVDINWEHDPEWGEIIIKPDPDTTFPIKVTIAADTDGVLPGHKSQSILVTVDGQVHPVEVLLIVVATRPTMVPGSRTTAPPPGWAPATPSSPVAAVPRPTARFLTRGRLMGAVVLGLMLICGWVIRIWLDTELHQEEQAKESINQAVNEAVSSIQEVEQIIITLTPDARVTRAARVEGIQQLITIENAELIPTKVIRPSCHPSECEQLDAITYTIVNGWVKTVKLNPGWSYYLEPGQYLWARWFIEELSPGQRLTFYQWLEPAETCIDVFVNGTGYEWKICPLDYVDR